MPDWSAAKLFVYGLLYRGGLYARTGGSLDDERAPDLSQIDIGRDIGRNLVIVDQTLIQA